MSGVGPWPFKRTGQWCAAYGKCPLNEPQIGDKTDSQIPVEGDAYFMRHASTTDKREYGNSRNTVTVMCVQSEYKSADDDLYFFTTLKHETSALQCAPSEDRCHSLKAASSALVLHCSHR